MATSPPPFGPSTRAEVIHLVNGAVEDARVDLVPGHEHIGREPFVVRVGVVLVAGLRAGIHWDIPPALPRVAHQGLDVQPVVPRRRGGPQPELAPDLRRRRPRINHGRVHEVVVEVVPPQNDSVLPIAQGRLARGDRPHPPRHLGHGSRGRLVQELAVRKKPNVPVVKDHVDRVLYLPLHDPRLDVGVPGHVDAIEPKSWSDEPKPFPVPLVLLFHQVVDLRAPMLGPGLQASFLPQIRVLDALQKVLAGAGRVPQRIRVATHQDFVQQVLREHNQRRDLRLVILVILPAPPAPLQPQAVQREPGPRPLQVKLHIRIRVPAPASHGVSPKLQSLLTPGATFCPPKRRPHPIV
mmetsp:Transcript_8408/g.24039  ORF Transcript_8408/g.24039 Transcript_8408/m.24039 type:complete len:352 (+) Transcript_8408:946-2001(+)